uniref:Glutamate receptor n=2 Tax=Hirondellea gigas TaxID=1518452 RepID=A0A6A7GA25_9CRUS
MLTHPETFQFPEPVELIVAAEEWVPHIAVREDPETGEVFISGPMANLLDTLAASINFKYKLVRPSDGAWGIPRGDGTGDWNGMIGMVKRDEADLALGPFGVTYSRTQVAAFTSPILIDYYRILVKRESPEPDPWGWRKPFTAGVYAGFIVSLVVVALALWATTSLFGISSTKCKEKRDRGIGILENVWLVYGTTVSQSMEWLAECWSGRTVMAVWFIVVLIVARSYGSCLTALLAVRSVATPYNYLSDLIDDPQIVLVFEGATALIEHFSKVKTGIFADLAGQKHRSLFLTPPQLYEAAYNDVRDTKTALLVEDITCRKVISDDFKKYGRCDFYVGKERYWPLIFCMIGQKHHPIVNVVNARIERLTSHDLYFKWLSSEMPNATACPSTSSKVTVREAYSMAGLWGLFIVLACGLCLAAVAFGAEIMLHRRRSAKAPDVSATT